MTATSSPVATGLRATGVLAVTAGLGIAAWLAWDALGDQPLGVVRFTTTAVRVDSADLERLAAGLRGRPAREVPLAEVRAAMRSIAWVREATVRWQFPAGLEIAFQEHEALARWDESRLVSPLGEVFTAVGPEGLPRFAGPEGSAPAITRAWPRLTAAAEPLGSPVTELRLTPRGAWQLRLASGLALELGRTDPEARLARFAAAWPSLAATAGGVTHADLRYPNGFALRGLPAAEKKAPPARPARRA